MYSISTSEVYQGTESLDACKTKSKEHSQRVMDRRTFHGELVPFVVLAANECSNTGLFTLFKAASNGGMSNHVFVAYAYSVASLVLLPVTFFYRRLANIIYVQINHKQASNLTGAPA